MEVNVTQSQLGTAEFQGTVEVDQPSYMTSNISITATVSTGWPIELGPQAGELTGPGTLEFEVTVVVPPATSSLTVGNVMVTASVKAPLLSAVVVAATAVVTVDQYFKLRLEVAEPQIHMERGQEGRMEVNIYNDGNGQDTFAIDLERVPEGVRVSLDQTQMTIPQDRNGTVVLLITVENDAPGGMHTIVVRATSLESGSGYSKTYPLFVRVETLMSGIDRVDAVVYIGLVVILAAVAVVLFRRHRSKEIGPGP